MKLVNIVLVAVAYGLLFLITTHVFLSFSLFLGTFLLGSHNIAIQYIPLITATNASVEFIKSFYTMLSIVGGIAVTTIIIAIEVNNYE